jgi:hypothetical protein
MPALAGARLPSKTATAARTIARRGIAGPPKGNRIDILANFRGLCLKSWGFGYCSFGRAGVVRI